MKSEMLTKFEAWHGFEVSKDMDIQTAVAWSAWKDAWRAARESSALHNEVIDLVDQWQRDGRKGFCLPVLRDELLTKLEHAADERRRDNCQFCDGTGRQKDYGDYWRCVHCEPMAPDA